MFSHQGIADTAADEIGGKSGVLEFFGDIDGVTWDIAFGNIVERSGQHEVSVSFFCDLSVVFIDPSIDFRGEESGGKADMAEKERRQECG